MSGADDGDAGRANGAGGDNNVGGYLGRGVQLVAFLFGAFSGFFSSVAPPDETNPQFTVGIASFGVLILFLIIIAIARSRRLKYVWIGAAVVLFAVFLVFAFKYQDDRAQLTIMWPRVGDDQKLYPVGDPYGLTRDAAEKVRNDPSLTPVVLVARYGGIAKARSIDARTQIWTHESIRASARTLLRDYLILVLSVCGAIFCLTEGVLLAATPPG